MLGRNHALMRRLRAVRRDASLRRTEGVFVAEGLHLAREALARSESIEAFFVSPRLTATPDGRAHPSFHDPNFDSARAPALISIVGIKDVRAGATFLMLTTGGNTPSGVVHRDGRGKAAVVLFVTFLIVMVRG